MSLALPNRWVPCGHLPPLRNMVHVAINGKYFDTSHTLEQVDPWGASPPSESAVHGAMDAAIHTSLPAFGTGAARDGTPWRPRGILVTHLVEHKKAVNRIAVAGNGAFFVTASDDETTKVRFSPFQVTM